MNPNWTYRIVVYPRWGRSLQAWSVIEQKWYHMCWIQ